jgi:hypothetical protein
MQSAPYKAPAVITGGQVARYPYGKVVYDSMRERIIYEPIDNEDDLLLAAWFLFMRHYE